MKLIMKKMIDRVAASIDYHLIVITSTTTTIIIIMVIGIVITYRTCCFEETCSLRLNGGEPGHAHEILRGTEITGTPKAVKGANPPSGLSMRLKGGHSQLSNCRQRQTERPNVTAAADAAAPAQGSLHWVRGGT